MGRRAAVLVALILMMATVLGRVVSAQEATPVPTHGGAQWNGVSPSGIGGGPDDFSGVVIVASSEALTPVDICYLFGPEGGQADAGCTENGYSEIEAEHGSYVLTVTSTPEGCAIVSPNPMAIEVSAPPEQPDAPSIAFAEVWLDCGTRPDLASGEVLVDAYLCADAGRAGTVEFVVGEALVFESALSCRLATASEQTFRLESLGDRPQREAVTDETGHAAFADVPFGTYALTELASGTRSVPFTFQPPFTDGEEVPDHAAVVVTAITYVEAVTPPPAGEGTGTVEVVVQVCVDEARAGEHDLFIGAGTVQGAEIDGPCYADLESGFSIDGDALTAPVVVSAFGSPLIATDLPPGSYVVTLFSSGLNSPAFDLAPGGYVRLTVVFYEGSDFNALGVEKFFCVDLERAGQVDFIMVADAADGGDTVGDAAVPEPDAPNCRLARDGEATFDLTKTESGTTWTQATAYGLGFAEFYDVPAGEFTLTERETGAVSAPFNLPRTQWVTVVNWVETVDQTPPPSQDVTGIGLNSILCVDPSRAGDAQFLIGTGAYDGPSGDAVAASTAECVADVGSSFAFTRASGEPISVITYLCGCTGFEAAPGRYSVTIDATGQTSPGFDVSRGRLTSITVVRWVTEIEPRAVVDIQATSCPIESTDPLEDCLFGNGLAGIRFTVGDQEIVTDEDGLALAGVPAGAVTITQDADDREHYAGTYVWCATGRDGPGLWPEPGLDPVVNGRADGGTVELSIPAGLGASCIWMNLIGPDASPVPGSTPVPTKTPTTGSVTTLPNTGANPGPAGGAAATVLLGLGGLVVVTLAGQVLRSGRGRMRGTRSTGPR